MDSINGLLMRPVALVRSDLLMTADLHGIPVGGCALVGSLATRLIMAQVDLRDVWPLLLEEAVYYAEHPLLEKNGESHARYR